MHSIQVENSCISPIDEQVEKINYIRQTCDFTTKSWFRFLIMTFRTLFLSVHLLTLKVLCRTCRLQHSETFNFSDENWTAEIQMK